MRVGEVWKCESADNVAATTDSSINSLLFSCVYHTACALEGGKDGEREGRDAHPWVAGLNSGEIQDVGRPTRRTSTRLGN